MNGSTLYPMARCISVR
ncbi:hypothetical protein RLOC_00012442 [Lonchura striata]|uniref:Uncharacterized protein n=1 Tax=Lonchura striata TaxID=40157 RepID=A0A218V8C2_9PASE|nr:hypothetical protein RLOC_00012442 [Lonchura striata domestica]